MSNVRKAFQTKSLLRRMADGGIFKSIVNGVPTFTDKDRAAPDAKAYVPTAMRELPNTGIVPGGTALPQAPAAPMPAPAKLSVAPAPAITVAPPRAGMTAPPVPAAPQDPYSKMTGKPPVPITPRTVRIPMNYMAQTGGFGPTTVPERRPRAIGSMRKEIGAERQDIGMGYLAASGGFMASGGEVKGPGGPTDDKVGPVMLSDGEYVLPADTVRAVGKENLDKLKDATHEPTGKTRQRGMLRRMADGGAPLLDNELARIQQHRRRNPEYYIPKQQVIERTPVPVEAAMPVRSIGVIPPPADVLSVDKAALADKLARSQTPTADMVRSGTPGRQPMPEQRPSEILSGQVNTGVMRDFAPAPAPAPPPAAKLSVKPRNMNVDMAAAFARGTAPASTPEAAATPAAPKTPGWGEKQAPGEVRGPDGSFNTLEPSPPRSIELDVPPPTLTTAQSNELERMKVSLGDQLQPVNAMKFGDPVDRGAIDRPMVATGEKQINSKFYRDATGAVKEGTATLFRPATEEDINKMPLNIGPRAFANLTLREGTEPGQQVNLGNGMFGTSSKPGGPIDTFTGVGKDFSADSARLGPDPEGKDRARQDAMVERNLQARQPAQTPRGIAMPEVRSNARDINARFDKLAKDAASRFSSPRAAGNLNKALTQIEAQRMAALGQDAENMTRQQQVSAQAQLDQSRNALTERDIASREATAARADETDRLAIGAQDRRAADAASAAAASADREFDRKNYEVAVRNKQFSGTYNDWVAYGGTRKRGNGAYVNPQEIERNTKRVTDRVTQMFPDDPEAQQNVIANSRLFWGAPDSAVATYAPVINSIAQKLGRPDIGIPQLTEGGSETWDASAADLQKGADNWWTDVRAELWDGDGPAYKFVTDGGEEIFIAKSRLNAKEQRFVQAYLQSLKNSDQKERD